MSSEQNAKNLKFGFMILSCALCIISAAVIFWSVGFWPIGGETPKDPFPQRIREVHVTELNLQAADQVMQGRLRFLEERGLTQGPVSSIFPFLYGNLESHYGALRSMASTVRSLARILPDTAAMSQQPEAVKSGISGLLSQARTFNGNYVFKHKVLVEHRGWFILFVLSLFGGIYTIINRAKEA
ncbi:MAG: hypothetical protein WCV50_03975 [Patescibacteria group bacterium]|jgi:hypothetical protein